MKAAAEGKAMGRSSPKAVRTSRSATLSGLQPFSPRVSAAPTGVPVDQHVSEDDHHAGSQCHPENLGLRRSARPEKCSIATQMFSWAFGTGLEPLLRSA